MIDLTFLFTPQVQAFEDYIITTDGKLTQISIENNQIIDVFPLITILNEKNTLIVHPLKEGITAFTVKKNGQEKFMFNILVEEDKTEISPNDGFEILPIDEPPIIMDYMIDEPPGVNKRVNKEVEVNKEGNKETCNKTSNKEPINEEENNG